MNCPNCRKEKYTMKDLAEELDAFLDFEGDDVSSSQYEFLNGFLLKEMYRLVEESE